MSRPINVREELAFALRLAIEKRWPEFREAGVELHAYYELVEDFTSTLSCFGVEIVITRELASELLVAMKKGPAVLDEEGDDECPGVH